MRLGKKLESSNGLREGEKRRGSTKKNQQPPREKDQDDKDQTIIEEGLSVTEDDKHTLEEHDAIQEDTREENGEMNKMWVMERVNFLEKRTQN